MEPGQIEVPHIPAVKSTGPVAFKYGMGCLIGHDVIAVLDQFTKFIIDWFQTLCGSHHPVTYGGRTQMDSFTLKDIPVSYTHLMSATSSWSSSVRTEITLSCISSWSGSSSLAKISLRRLIVPSSLRALSVT